MAHSVVAWFWCVSRCNLWFGDLEKCVPSTVVAWFDDTNLWHISLRRDFDASLDAFCDFFFQVGLYIKITTFSTLYMRAVPHLSMRVHCSLLVCSVSGSWCKVKFALVLWRVGAYYQTHILWWCQEWKRCTYEILYLRLLDEQSPDSAISGQKSWKALAGMAFVGDLWQSNSASSRVSVCLRMCKLYAAFKSGLLSGFAYRLPRHW